MYKLVVIVIHFLPVCESISKIQRGQEICGVYVLNKPPFTEILVSSDSVKVVWSMIILNIYWNVTGKVPFLKNNRLDNIATGSKAILARVVLNKNSL